MSGITPGGAQALNMTHMFEFTDLRSCKKNNIRTDEKSIAWYINTNNEFSIFKRILFRSGMTELFSTQQSYKTLLIPTDSFIRENLFEKDKTKEEIFFQLLDVGTARGIVNSSTLPDIINSDILKSSPNAYYITKDHKMRMYIFNVSGQTFINTGNQPIKVVSFDICLGNGIIHIIDNLIIPNECTFIN